MVHYDCTEKKHFVPIPRDYAKRPERKSCFIDRNRISSLPMKSAKPLFLNSTERSVRKVK